MRLIFMGTPDFAVPALAALIDAGHEIACVYSQPPRPAGRGQRERPSPVQAFAEERGIAVRYPASLKTEDAQEEFAALDADVAVVAAYGLILPKAVLEAPRLGCINIHASLLPRWRGAAPIQRAIMAGDEQTGVQIQQMEAGLDTGPILLSETVRISPEDTAASLHDRLMDTGALMWPRLLSALERDSLEAVPQSEEGVTYARKISSAEARIDWTRPAEELVNHVRGLSPFPGAWFELDTGKGRTRVKVLQARVAGGEGAPGTVLDDSLKIACGENSLHLTRLQREGKSAMNAEDFLRGNNIPAGMVLD